MLLRSGEELQLELSGDRGETNDGMLVFAGPGQCPEYVPLSDVEQIAVDQPSAKQGRRGFDDVTRSLPGQFSSLDRVGLAGGLAPGTAIALRLSGPFVSRSSSR